MGPERTDIATLLAVLLLAGATVASANIITDSARASGLFDGDVAAVTFKDPNGYMLLNGKAAKDGLVPKGTHDVEISLKEVALRLDLDVSRDMDIQADAFPIQVSEIENKLVAKAMDITLSGVRDTPITLTIDYTDEELKALNINEDSLAIYHYNGLTWVKMPSTVDTENNIVTCRVVELSPFALAGDPISGDATALRIIGNFDAYARPNQSVILTGAAYYNNNTFPDSPLSINATLDGTSTIKNTDGYGNFIFNLTAPATAGTYTINLTATSSAPAFTNSTTMTLNVTTNPLFRVVVNDVFTYGDATNSTVEYDFPYDAVVENSTIYIEDAQSITGSWSYRSIKEQTVNILLGQNATGNFTFTVGGLTDVNATDARLYIHSEHISGMGANAFLDSCIDGIDLDQDWPLPSEAHEFKRLDTSTWEWAYNVTQYINYSNFQYSHVCNATQGTDLAINISGDLKINFTATAPVLENLTYKLNDVEFYSQTGIFESAYRNITGHIQNGTNRLNFNSSTSGGLNYTINTTFHSIRAPNFTKTGDNYSVALTLENTGSAHWESPTVYYYIPQGAHDIIVYDKNKTEITTSNCTIPYGGGADLIIPSSVIGNIAGSGSRDFEVNYSLQMDVITALDKIRYTAGETVNLTVNVTLNGTLTNANVTVNLTSPTGNKTLQKVAATQIGTGMYNLNFTLPANSLHGAHTFDVTAAQNLDDIPRATTNSTDFELRKLLLFVQAGGPHLIRRNATITGNAHYSSGDMAASLPVNITIVGNLETNATTDAGGNFNITFETNATGGYTVYVNATDSDNLSDSHLDTFTVLENPFYIIVDTGIDTIEGDTFLNTNSSFNISVPACADVRSAYLTLTGKNNKSNYTYSASPPPIAGQPMGESQYSNLSGNFTLPKGDFPNVNVDYAALYVEWDVGGGSGDTWFRNFIDETQVGSDQSITTTPGNYTIAVTGSIVPDANQTLRIMRLLASTTQFIVSTEINANYTGIAYTPYNLEVYEGGKAIYTSTGDYDGNVTTIDITKYAKPGNNTILVKSARASFVDYIANVSMRDWEYVTANTVKTDYEFATNATLTVTPCQNETWENPEMTYPLPDRARNVTVYDLDNGTNVTINSTVIDMYNSSDANKRVVIPPSVIGQVGVGGSRQFNVTYIEEVLNFTLAKAKEVYNPGDILNVTANVTYNYAPVTDASATATLSNSTWSEIFPMAHTGGGIYRNDTYTVPLTHALGTYNLSVRAEDTTGRERTGTTNFTVRKLTVTAGTAGTYTVGNTVLISGNVNDTKTGAAIASGSVNITIANGSIVNTSTVSISSGAYSFNRAADSAGSYNVTAAAIDGSGIRGTVNTSYFVKYNVTTDAGGNFNRDKNVPINVTVKDKGAVVTGASVTVSVTLPNTTVVTLTTAGGDVADRGDGNYSLTFNQTQPLGTYTVSATAATATSNGTAQGSFYVSELNVTAVTSKKIYTAGENVRINGTVRDAYSGAGLSSAKLNLSLYNSTGFVQNYSNTTTSNGNYSFTLSGVKAHRGYQANLTVNYNTITGANQTTFDILYNTSVVTDKSEYPAGDTIKINATVLDSDGSGVPGANATINVTRPDSSVTTLTTMGGDLTYLGSGVYNGTFNSTSQYDDNNVYRVATLAVTAVSNGTDTTSFNVTKLNLSSIDTDNTEYSSGESIYINVTVLHSNGTGIEGANVTTNVTHPDAFVTTFNTSDTNSGKIEYLGGGIYNCTFTNTTGYGQYNITATVATNTSNGTINTSVLVRKIIVGVGTDAILYSPGEKVVISGTIKDQDFVPVSGDLNLSILNFTWALVNYSNISVGSSGVYQYNYTLDVQATAGNYTIWSNATRLGITGSNQTIFEVELILALGHNRYGYMPGDPVNITISVINGTQIVEGAIVNVTVGNVSEGLKTVRRYKKPLPISSPGGNLYNYTLILNLSSDADILAHSSTDDFTFMYNGSEPSFWVERLYKYSTADYATSGQGATCSGGTNCGYAIDATYNTAQYWEINAAQNEDLYRLGTIDFGQTRPDIGRIDLQLWDGDGRFYYNYALTTSTDGTDNVTRFNGTGSGINYQGRQTVTFEPTDVRYITVWISGNTLSTNGSVIEAYAYSVVNTSYLGWVKAPDITSSYSEGNTPLEVYYGKPDASPLGNASNVFEFYEDFEGPSVNTSRFDYSSDYLSIENGKLAKIGNGSWGYSYIFTKQTFARTPGLAFFARFWTPSAVNSPSLMIGWKDSGAGYSYTDMPYATYFIGSGAIRTYEDGTNRGNSAYTYSPGKWYDVMTVLNTTGADSYYRESGTGAWTLIISSPNSSESNLRPGISTNTNFAYIDDFRVFKYSGGLIPSFGAEQDNDNWTIETAIYNGSCTTDSSGECNISFILPQDTTLGAYKMEGNATTPVNRGFNFSSFTARRLNVSAAAYSPYNPRESNLSGGTRKNIIITGLTKDTHFSFPAVGAQINATLYDQGDAHLASRQVTTDLSGRYKADFSSNFNSDSNSGYYNITVTGNDSYIIGNTTAQLYVANVSETWFDKTYDYRFPVIIKNAWPFTSSYSGAKYLLNLPGGVNQTSLQVRDISGNAVSISSAWTNSTSVNITISSGLLAPYQEKVFYTYFERPELTGVNTTAFAPITTPLGLLLSGGTQEGHNTQIVFDRNLYFIGDVAWINTTFTNGTRINTSLSANVSIYYPNATLAKNYTGETPDENGTVTANYTAGPTNGIYTINVTSLAAGVVRLESSTFRIGSLRVNITANASVINLCNTIGVNVNVSNTSDMPVENATITFYIKNSLGTTQYQNTKNSTQAGNNSFNWTTSCGQTTGTYTIEAYADTANNSGYNTSTFKVWNLTANVTSDDTVYDIGETIIVSGIVLNNGSGVNASLNLTVTNSTGYIFYNNDTSSSNSAGDYSYNFSLTQIGTRTASIKAQYSGISYTATSSSFNVRDLNVTVSAGSTYRPGIDTVTISGFVKDRENGSNIANASVNIVTYTPQGVVYANATVNSSASGAFSTTHLANTVSGTYAVNVSALDQANVDGNASTTYRVNLTVDVFPQKYEHNIGDSVSITINVTENATKVENFDIITDLNITGDGTAALSTSSLEGVNALKYTPSGQGKTIEKAANFSGFDGVSMWVKYNVTQTSVDRDIRLSIRANDSTGWHTGYNATIANGWNNIKVPFLSFTGFDTATGSKIHLAITRDTSTGTYADVYLDDMRFYKTPDPSAVSGAGLTAVVTAPGGAISTYVTPTNITENSGGSYSFTFTGTSLLGEYTINAVAAKGQDGGTGRGYFAIKSFNISLDNATLKLTDDPIISGTAIDALTGFAAYDNDVAINLTYPDGNKTLLTTLTGRDGKFSAVIPSPVQSGTYGIFVNTSNSGIEGNRTANITIGLHLNISTL
ncbi:DUF2341 domain-containing protein, partial [archaeon]|nr:DUF2341 domain-containing protein [archaeon]